MIEAQRTMWNLVAEQPLLVAVMIGIVVAGLLYGWLQTGDRRLALAGLIGALLIPGAFLLASAIETDREKILGLIDATAAAVQANDHQRAVAVIDDARTRQQALSELPRYEFDRVAVRNIQIKFVAGSFPPEATVDLDASVTASRVRGGLKNIRVPRRVILTFQKRDDGRWVVTDYAHQPLVGGPDPFSSSTFD